MIRAGSFLCVLILGLVAPGCCSVGSTTVGSLPPTQSAVLVGGAYAVEPNLAEIVEIGLIPHATHTTSSAGMLLEINEDLWASIATQHSSFQGNSGGPIAQTILAQLALRTRERQGAVARYSQSTVLVGSSIRFGDGLNAASSEPILLLAPRQNRFQSPLIGASFTTQWAFFEEAPVRPYLEAHIGARLGAATFRVSDLVVVDGAFLGGAILELGPFLIWASIGPHLALTLPSPLLFPVWRAEGGVALAY